MSVKQWPSWSNNDLVNLFENNVLISGTTKKQFCNVSESNS